MFMIGIDPHKGSHTATAVDVDEAVVGEIRVDADRHQRDRLLAWAAAFEPRTWAIEGATGMGAMLAQQLVGAGEHVVDVPPKLSARVRLMDTGRIDKTDPNDARSAAIVGVAQRHAEHRDRRGRAPGRVAAAGRPLPPAHRPADPHGVPSARRVVSAHRGRHRPLPEGQTGHETPGQRAYRGRDHRRAGRDLHRLRHRDRHPRPGPAPTPAPGPSPRSSRRRRPVTDIYGIGPIGAAIIVGRSGDIRRFPTAGHFARHNGTAPIEASSGPKARHRLNPRGDRQLNHAIHTAGAHPESRHDTPGRVYYLRKQAEGKTRKEAMRALKRRISDVVYRQLISDTRD